MNAESLNNLLRETSAYVASVSEGIQVPPSSLHFGNAAVLLHPYAWPLLIIRGTLDGALRCVGQTLCREI